MPAYGDRWLLMAGIRGSVVIPLHQSVLVTDKVAGLTCQFDSCAYGARGHSPRSNRDSVFKQIVNSEYSAWHDPCGGPEDSSAPIG